MIRFNRSNSKFCSSLAAGLIWILLSGPIAVAAPETAPGNPPALDSKCIAGQSHSKLTLLLVDRSEALADPAGLQHELATVKNLIERDERLVVAVGAEPPNAVRIVFDQSRPAKSIWTPPVKTRRRDAEFDECFAAMSHLVSAPQEVHRGSALFEDLAIANSILQSDWAQSKRLVVFSDMVQQSDRISFYLQKKIDPLAELEKASAAGLVYQMDQVSVLVAGAGAGVSEEKAQDIAVFWKGYFEKANGNLVGYGKELPSN